MSPTRRDTLKAAGAASGLAMLGGHAVAQQGSPGGDDSPGAQSLEEGQAGVRVGHFVSGAPAVNVRLVPADGSTGSDDSAGDGGTDAENGTETGGNATDDNVSEDLQVANDSNGTNDTAGNDTDDGLVGDNETDDSTDGGTTTDGEGELIAEDVTFGDVSEYASVEAGDYTVRVVEYTEVTTDTDDPTGTDNTTGNTTDDNMTDDNASDAGSDDDPIISLPDDVTGGGNDSDDNETGGNTSDDNVSEDLQVANDSNGTNGTAGNETDGGLGGDDAGSDGEVLYEEDVTVGESYYTVAATGTADDIQTLLLQDYDAAQVRLVHASPDAPAVDVVAPDASMTLFDGVTFGQGTEYVGVPPGSYSLSIREAADMNDGDEVGTSDVELEAGQAYSVYAVGSPEGGEEEFQLVVEQDGQGADAGLGSDDAPGQQGDGPGQGNESGGPGGDGPPGQANDSDGPGQSGNAGGPSADESDEADDEPGGPGGAAGPNDSGNNGSGNASGNESGTETEEDDGGLFAY